MVRTVFQEWREINPPLLIDSSSSSELDVGIMNDSSSTSSFGSDPRVSPARQRRRRLGIAMEMLLHSDVGMEAAYSGSMAPSMIILVSSAVR